MTESPAPTGTDLSHASLEDVCSLSPDALRDRLAMIRREIEPYAIATQSRDDGMAWDFEATAEMRAKLENLARLERDCCSDFEFDVWEDAPRRRLRFEISDPEPTTGFFRAPSWGDSPNGDAVDATPGWRKLLRWAGVGTVASLAVCCLLPIALVSIAGVTVAAPLMKLDQPGIIALGALFFAGLFGIYESRRRAASMRASKDVSVGCDC